MEKRLILIGGGGHCKSCIDVIEQEGRYKICGILDQKERIGQKVLNYEIIGTDEMIGRLISEGFSFLITIGQIETAGPRVRLFQELRSLDAELATVVSPRAYVSQYASIGEGSIIMHHALVNAGASVGCNCIVNSKALIEHDASIADHCHISTAAAINGNTIIKAQTFFGSSAVSQEGAIIPAESFVKAASVVRRV